MDFAADWNNLFQSELNRVIFCPGIWNIPQMKWSGPKSVAASPAYKPLTLPPR
ncbi:MAG TPA: hypothetical protein VKS20_15380 [Candidatus Acidoferrales bacterium]|nr:hypothetical protein [Candidatus Acidoferrales bacterium]